MNIWIQLATTTSLGAVIGGYTNHLAIKMLFRPHNPVYIGKFRVPFTPGLIPKRRDELALQLGRMVVNHLLTPEGIQRKLQDSSFQGDLVEWAQTGVDQLLTSERALRDIVQALHIEQPESKIAHTVERMLENKIEEMLATYGSVPLEEVIPANILIRIEEEIPKAAGFLQRKGIAYFESAEGKARIAKMMDDFFASRGTLLNLVGMFLGNESLVEKVQPEIVKFLQQSGTKQFLEELMKTEWNALKGRNVEEIEVILPRERLVQMISSFLKADKVAASLLDKSVVEFMTPYRNMIIERWVPHTVQLILAWFSDNIATVMERLHLSEIVQNEVSTFPTERLEEMVLSITKSELKMITYLGALLGGVIGIVQGIVLAVLA